MSVYTRISADSETRGVIHLLAKMAFKCRRCGKCCNGTFFKGVPLSPEDITRLERHLGRSISDLCYTEEHNGSSRQCLRLSCPFFDGKKCTIHPVRPKNCREFPIFVGKDYFEIHTNCPQGDRFFKDFQQHAIVEQSFQGEANVSV